jgi:hypothetical protein
MSTEDQYFAVQVQYWNEPEDQWETILTTLKQEIAQEYVRMHQGDGGGKLRLICIAEMWPAGDRDDPTNPKPCVHFRYAVEAAAWGDRRRNVELKRVVDTKKVSECPTHGTN